MLQCQCNTASHSCVCLPLLVAFFFFFVFLLLLLLLLLLVLLLLACACFFFVFIFLCLSQRLCISHTRPVFSAVQASEEKTQHQPNMPGEKIVDLIRAKEEAGERFVSFEFFPPKTDAGLQSLVARIGRYKEQGVCRACRVSCVSCVQDWMRQEQPRCCSPQLSL